MKSSRVYISEDSYFHTWLALIYIFCTSIRVTYYSKRKKYKMKISRNDIKDAMLTQKIGFKKVIFWKITSSLLNPPWNKDDLFSVEELGNKVGLRSVILIIVFS